MSQPMAESIQSRLPEFPVLCRSFGGTRFIWPARHSSGPGSPCTVMQGLHDGYHCMFIPAGRLRGAGKWGHAWARAHKRAGRSLLEARHAALVYWWLWGVGHSRERAGRAEGRSGVAAPARQQNDTEQSNLPSTVKPVVQATRTQRRLMCTAR